MRPTAAPEENPERFFYAYYINDIKQYSSFFCPGTKCFADRTKTQYTSRVTASNNQVLQTCPFTLTSTGSAVRAYPNPTQGKVVIESSTLAEGDRIDGYNSTGRLVNRFSADAHPTEIDFGNLPQGIYVIKVKEERVKIRSSIVGAPLVGAPVWAPYGAPCASYGRPQGTPLPYFTITFCTSEPARTI